MNTSSKEPTPALLRRVADALVVGILTGHDWPNDQKELTRLQAAELLRTFAARIEGGNAVENTHESPVLALRELAYQADKSLDYRPEFRRAIAVANAALGSAD